MATAEEYMQVFKKGTIVEVSSEDQGLRGSWYTATVIRSISEKNLKMLVEYHNLISDETPAKPLREFVAGVLVRPIPPRDSPTRRYSLMEDVDAYHNDGWWEGVVTKVLEGSRRRYAVFFRCSREEIEFDASDLRVRREWVRGDVWVNPMDLSLSPRKKRKNGDREEKRNGTYSADHENGVIRNGEERDLGKRSRNVSSKQVAVEKNGCSREARRTSNRSVNKDAATRKRQERVLENTSNGTSRKLGVRRNGKLKEPRRRASNHTGRQQSKK